MSRTLDVLETDDHGTVEGYRSGCRGANCPAADFGMSCMKANTLAAGNWQYIKAVRRGLTPREIAEELGLTRAPEPKKPARPLVEPEDLDIEEEPMTTTPKTKKQGPSQSEVRAWARANGIEVSNRGTLPRAITDAYNARDKGVQASDVKPVFEIAPEPVQVGYGAADEPAPIVETYVALPRPSVDWSLPLTSSDLRALADALEKIETVPLDIVDLNDVPVNRPGGADIIGHFRLAADFEGDDAWLGFVPLGGAA